MTTTIYTDTEARQKLDDVLNEARSSGEVRIKRSDGEEFVIRPISASRSPLDVPGIPTDLTADEIVRAVREGRDR